MTKTSTALRNWWSRKPPASRHALAAGLLLTFALLAAGLATDIRGLEGSWPFLTSAVRDLFRVVVIGTAGVLFVDEYREWTRNWPELRAGEPQVVGAINRFSSAVVGVLGLGERVELSSAISLWSASQQLQRLQAYLADARGSLEERIDLTLRNDLSSTETSALRHAWYESTLGGTSPKEAAFAHVQPMVAVLRVALNEIAPYTSAGTRAEISHVAVRLDDVPTAIETLTDGLRDVFNDDSISQGTLRAIHKSLITICTSLSLLVIVVDRLTHEHDRGRAFPGRSYFTLKKSGP